MKLTKEDLVGTLSKYPLALAQLIVDRTLKQHPSRSLGDIAGARLKDLFTWRDTPEGEEFWNSIDEGDFTPYFERYCKVNAETQYEAEDRLRFINKYEKLKMDDSDALKGFYETELVAFMYKPQFVDLKLLDKDRVISFCMSKKNAVILRDFLNEFLSQPK